MENLNEGKNDSNDSMIHDYLDDDYEEDDTDSMNEEYLRMQKLAGVSI